MKKYQFKTNIMCNSCIEKVTPVLNQSVGENQWQIDLKDPKRTLTVSSENIIQKDIINALQKVGYKADEI
ncbi:MAG: heavy-metal-associated domain-containing protein [Ginsengibacter sp.]